MSTSIPSAVGAIPAAPKNSFTASAPQDATDQNAQALESGFSAVLADFMQAALPPMLINQAIADPAKRQADTSPAQGLTNTALPELSATFTDLPTGNALPGTIPVVAWSGMVAAGNENGAAVMLMSGDANQALIGKPVHATNMNTAMQLADQPALLKSLSPINGQASWESFLPVQLQLATAQRTAALPTTDGPPRLTTANDDVFAALAQEPILSHTGTTAVTPYIATARLDTTVGNIALPITHPNWSNNLGESIRWMVQQQSQQADFRLTPPDLGMLEVRVQVNNNQTNITFSSPHALVCDAVESALPRLRDMFGQAGLPLGDVNVNVSQQSMSQQHAQNGGSPTPQHGGGDGRTAVDTDALPHTVPPLVQRYGSGLVDVYA